MKKHLIIDDCRECPHFDSEYYTYADVCTKLGVKILPEEKIEDGMRTLYYTIPSNCPLTTAN
jgi:hypothetical protein